MKLTRMQVNPFGEMTYVLWHEDGKDAIVVDPGMMAENEREAFAEFVSTHHLNITNVLLTHIHIDHVASVEWVKQKYGAQVLFGKDDLAMMQWLPMQAARFGLNLNITPFEADRYLADGDCVELNGDEIKALATPGHSAGSLSFYIKSCSKLLSGDALFNMSIGRTDLPGGNYDTLIASIKQKIMTLPEDTVIYPGHGDCTTVGEEKLYNPFLK